MQMANICRMFIKTVVRTGMLCQDYVNISKAGSQTPDIDNPRNYQKRVTTL